MRANWKTVALVLLILSVRLSLEKECTSLDIRGNTTTLARLEGCSVIKGFLKIVLTQPNATAADFRKYKFPELKEITEYFVLYDIQGLVSLGDLFPNLTVIRGRKLFLNYALAVYMLPDLRVLDLRSLIAIQRGHVFIARCAQLCFLDNINWDRLTLTRGDNHVRPAPGAVCPSNDIDRRCLGCSTNYCWSNNTCQKFENDNLFNLLRRPINCHPNCLGGCTKDNDSSRCRVCRGLTDHGRCVDECPEDKFLHSTHQRCYTRAECEHFDGHIFESECRKDCPSGYALDNATNTCERCEHQGCLKVCGEPGGLYLNQLSDFEAIDGCEVVNSSLVIRVRNVLDMAELAKYAGRIRRVSGFLKVHRSPSLTTLSFLSSLEAVEGGELEHEQYGIVVYDNAVLKELLQRKVQLLRGGIYMHLNRRLCNAKVGVFVSDVAHDKRLDSVQVNEHEVACEPVMFELSAKVLSHDTVTMSWKHNNFTMDQVEFMFKPVGKDDVLDERLLEEKDVCSEITWTRITTSADQIAFEKDFFHFNLTNLQAYTKYAILLKSYSAESSSQSALANFSTLPNIPRKIRNVSTLNKTETSLTLSWSEPQADEVRTHYEVEIFAKEDSTAELDLRNFCVLPKVRHARAGDDYDDCCALKEEAAEDEDFEANLSERYPCSLGEAEFCDAKGPDRMQIPGHWSSATLWNLERYTGYVFKISACNELGCGGYTLYSDRTNLSVTSDNVERLEACREEDVFRVRFDRPAHPNGAVISYSIHFRRTDPANPDTFLGLSFCLTPAIHAANGNVYTWKSPVAFEQVAVRSISLAGTALGQYLPIRQCRSAEGDYSVLVTFAVLLLLTVGTSGLYYARKNKLLPECGAPRWLGGPASGVVSEELLMEEFETVRFDNYDDEGYSD